MKRFLAALSLLLPFGAQSQDCGSFHLFNFQDTLVSDWIWPDPKPGFAFDMTYDSLTGPNTGYISFFFVDQNEDTITNPEYYRWSFFFPWTVEDTLGYVMVLDSGLNTFPSNFDGFLVTENPSCKIPYSNKGLFVSSINPASSFLLYPNPSAGNFIVDLGHKAGLIQVISMRGRIIHEEFVNGKSQVTLPPSFISGIYYVRLQNEDHSSIQRLVIE